MQRRSSPMEICRQGSGLIIAPMAMANICGQMVVCMLANGLEERQMVKESLAGLQVLPMRVNSRMGIWMVKGPT